MRVLALVVVLFTATSSTAQTSWRAPMDALTVSADLLVALGDDLDGTWGVGGTTEPFTLVALRSAILLSARVPVGPGAVVVEIPFGFVRETVTLASRNEPTVSDAGLGNPYVGLEADGEGWTIAAGVRAANAKARRPLPSGPRQANLEAANAALDPERASVFTPFLNAATLTAGLDAPLGPSVRLRLRAGPVYSWGRLGRSGSPGEPSPSTNLSGVGTGSLDVEVGPAVVTAGASALYEPDSGSIRYREPIRLHALAGVTARPIVAGPRIAVRPGLLVRVPVVGFSIADAAAGFSVDVLLR